MRAERITVMKRLMVVLEGWLRSASARRDSALFVPLFTILAWNVLAVLSNKCKRESKY